MEPQQERMARCLVEVLRMLNQSIPHLRQLTIGNEGVALVCQSIGWIESCLGLLPKDSSEIEVFSANGG